MSRDEEEKNAINGFTNCSPFMEEKNIMDHLQFSPKLKLRDLTPVIQ
jgi:hypothetical protein